MKGREERNFLKNQIVYFSIDKKYKKAKYMRFYLLTMYAGQGNLSANNRFIDYKDSTESS